MPPMNPARSPESGAASASRLAGWLVATMLVLTVLAPFWPVLPRWLAGAVGWLAALLLWSETTRGLRWQIAILITIGLAAFVWGSEKGGVVDPLRMLSQNDALLAMLAAVSFLRLVQKPLGDREIPMPVGPVAYLHTLLGVHLFGAAINISGMVIIGDRLARDRQLERRDALALCRSFCPAVFYSPFIGGMALALHHAPSARLGLVMPAGMLLAMVALGHAFIAERGRLDDFRGYPIHYASLWIPTLLALSVFSWHRFDPELSVLLIISVLSPVAAAGGLTLSRGARGAVDDLVVHVGRRLPEMAGELWLFLAAGVLGVGLSNAFSSAHGWQPMVELTGTSASLIVLLSTAVSMVGVHPVVTLVTAVGLLESGSPDPTLLVMMFVMAWGIGCAGNPLSGQVLTIQARYGVSGWNFPRWNFRYCMVLCGAAALLLHAYDWLR